MRLRPHPNPGTLADFDMGCVDSLNEIIRVTDCEIVVSSDWKYWVDLDEMVDFYLRQGIVKGPVDYTPKKKIYSRSETERVRASEILEWLEGRREVECWVWTDDLDMRPFIGNSAWVSGGEGIVSARSEIAGILGFSGNLSAV